MTALLRFDIRSYWLSGTGRSDGFLHDLEPLTDRDGLPYLPGRQVRGLLRAGVRCLAAWGHVAPEAEEVLFGREGRFTSGPQAAQGLLDVRSARVPQALGRALASDPGLVNGLYRTLYSTAMQDGLARDKSLRSARVAVPMVLEASIGLGPSVSVDALPEPQRSLAGSWQDIVAQAASLLRGVGGGRQHGLGRVQVELVEQVA